MGYEAVDRDKRFEAVDFARQLRENSRQQFIPTSEQIAAVRQELEFRAQGGIPQSLTGLLHRQFRLRGAHAIAVIRAEAEERGVFDLHVEGPI